MTCAHRRSFDRLKNWNLASARVTVLKEGESRRSDASWYSWVGSLTWREGALRRWSSNPIHCKFKIGILFIIRHDGHHKPFPQIISQNWMLRPTIPSTPLRTMRPLSRKFHFFSLAIDDEHLVIQLIVGLLGSLGSNLFIIVMGIQWGDSNGFQNKLFKCADTWGKQRICASCAVWRFGARLVQPRTFRNAYKY